MDKLCLLALLLITSSTISAQDITSGLKLHYKFETAATIPDNSGSNQKGIKNGSVTTVIGVCGNAMHFATSSDYIKLPDNITKTLTDFSVACWVKLDQVNASSRIFDFGTGPASYMSLTPLASGAGLRFSITTSGKAGEEQINCNTPLPAGVWVHVAVVREGTLGILYVNGAQVATNASMTLSPSALGVTTQNYIAKSQSPDPALAGSIDEFRIYNRALTATDLLMLRSATTPRYAENVSISPSLKRQTMIGWGGSLCWWAHIMGGYSDSEVKTICDWITDPVHGLNMNIFRFNIGGGDDPTHKHMGYGKDLPGYKASATAPYDWTQDANQRKIVKQLIASRIAQSGGNDIHLVAFSNSPPFWMTNSGCTSGSKTASTPNLKPDMADDFADYLTEVTRYYHDSLGITFNTIEAFNEPDGWWWTAPKDVFATGDTQEGCYFNPDDELPVIRELYKKLVTKNMLSYCTIVASDANSIDAGVQHLQQFINAGDILSKINRVDVHTYGGSQRAALLNLATTVGKKVWQSESSPVWVTGTANEQIMVMANRIVADMKGLQCPVWLDWQIGAGTGATQWGLILADYANKSHTLTKSPAFYTRAQFSRYIKPGYTVIDNSHENVLTAISPDTKELVVTVNNADIFSRQFSFDLSAFTDLGAQIKQVRTLVVDSYGNTETNVPLTGTSFTSDVPAGSVTTYIIPINRNLPVSR
ncbi:MAG TPA: LamG-like jellyroll fold domain-containing protein [Paludibacter sp.]|nr:LamG-like jellyroll fold domain-containing protein [Paludibacter sp.]